ncbi:hypothetical protein [Isoptericola croceus]|uniref:hypothetical protein n=1 Tax=Isoptericola croceus TaxID=3031406 RepID=UPI0023F6A562|nr:hypothetical protein [Isoptericola croceus]
MTRLVLLHGRDADGQDPDAVESRWLGALNAGLAATGSPLRLADDDATFVYYGDTLTPPDGGARPPVTVHVLDDPASGPTLHRLSLDEARFALAVAREVLAGAGVPAGASTAVGPEEGTTVRLGGSFADAIARSLLAALAAIDRLVPGLSGAVVLLLARDVHTYLHDQDARSAVDAGLAAALPTDEPVVLVAHSLGTVVAYEVLRRQAPTRWDVPLLLTLGAPLAIEAVRSALAADGPLTWPAAGRWVNARDHRDLLALHDLTPVTFPLLAGAPLVEALRVRNTAPWHHAAAVRRADGTWTGYLASPRVAELVAAGLAVRA